MRWYVAQVETGKELAVRGALQAAGIHAKVPQEEVQVRKGGIWSPKLKVLIPGYVFFGCDTFGAETYYAIKRIPAILQLLGKSKPEPISYTEAEYIGVLAPTDAPLAPSVVADGKVVEGVLTRLPASIVKIDERQRRAKVQLTLLGREKLLVDFAIQTAAGADAAEGDEPDGGN